MSAHGRDDISEFMLQRVYGEFLEMPGLRLTSTQAQRLWGLDEQTCLLILEFFVEAKFLYRPGHGMYMRLTDGSAECPQLRMANANLDESVRRT